MITGSCLCRTVRWQVDGPLENMSHCHCSMCRKAHAAPFGTYVSAARADFSWVSGEDAVTQYESSPGVTRGFCNGCGSVAPEVMDDDRIVLPAGCLDGDPGIRPMAHIFASSKAPWHVTGDGLKQYDGYPEDDGHTTVERPAPAPSTDGVLRGSCLCGGVAYEVRTPIKAAFNCHCSRCRKARAAAHATNGFTAMEGVVFTRGEDLLKTYKLPSARYFSQAFCTRCGSGMPRLDPERQIAIIPFGSLDDDPGRGADGHIYVGSMAPWYTIEDDLPQHEEMPG